MNISATILFLAIILLIAAVHDICFRKIPNWLTFSGVFMAIFYHTVTNGFKGFVFSIEGIAVGIVVLLIIYFLGGIGAGDVKLMGAVGGLLGPKGAFFAFLFTSFVGGIYAIALLAVHGYLKEAAKRYGSMIRTFIVTKNFIYLPPSKNEQKPKLCYGVAIALGTLISVVIGLRI